MTEFVSPITPEHAEALCRFMSLWDQDTPSDQEKQEMRLLKSFLAECQRKAFPHFAFVAPGIERLF